MPSVEEFTQNVTMHGIKNVYSSKTFILRRAVWMMLVLGSLAYFIFSSCVFFNQVTKNLVHTKVSIERASHLKFPTVTVCNQNHWRLSAVESVDNGTFLSILKEIYSGLARNQSKQYNWSDPSLQPLANMRSYDVEYLLESLAPRLSNSVMSCSIFGVSYDCNDAIKVVKTDGGYCFQLNSNGSIKATSAGKTGGVTLSLNADVIEYTPGPASFSTGFSVAVHESHQVPLMTELSVGVRPGTQTSIVVHKSEMSRQPPPADGGKANCFDTVKLPNPLHYYRNYSYSACQVECKTSYVINKCGCRDALQPALNGTRACTIPEMVGCSSFAVNSFPSDESGLMACLCRNPCLDSEYTTQTSSFEFPSDNFISQQKMSPGVALYVKKNMVLLDIFYGKLSYQKLEEHPAYTPFDMIANIGGTLGLCVGASILTLCEFLEFGIVSLFKNFTRFKRRKSKVAATKVGPIYNDNLV